MGTGMGNTQRNTGKAKPTPAVLAIIAVCSIAVSGLIAFGNPTMWATAEQQAAAKAAPDQSAQEGKGSTSPDRQVISEYKTVSQSEDAQRAHNVALATEAVNGVEIKPGETFSFNDLVGDTEHDERYQLAPVIYGSDIEYARGGGICQVSTTLYVAALKADMQVVERHAHSLVSDYAPIGLDATLVYGLMDLKLKNNSEYPVWINAKSVGQTVTVAIEGHPLGEGVSIDVTSKIIKRYDGQEARQITGDTGSSDKTLYVVEAYRVYYKDGVKTSSTLLSTNTYEVFNGSTVMLGEGGVDSTK